MTVYKITNNANGKGYVGCTSKPLRARWSGHRSLGRRGCPHPLYRAMRKYGLDAFTIEVLAEAASLEEMIALEKVWIARERTRSPNGYNLTDGGEGCLGRIPSAATRKKIAAANRAAMTDERRAALAESTRAQWRDPVQRAQLERSFRGKKISAEQRKKLSRALKGRKVSAETREKLRAAFTGKPRPAYVIERLREVATGRRHSAAARKKMSRQRTGKPKSEAWKASMRASHARRREAKQA